MKLSKKYLRSLKKKLLGCTFSIAVSVMLIAGSKLAVFSTPVSALKSLGTYIGTVLTSDEVNLINSNENKEIEKSTVTVTDDGIVICDSIVQGVRDCELDNGTYTFRVTGKTSDGKEESKDYKVELINEHDDVTYSLEEEQTKRTVSLGDNTTDYKMLVVKYHGNLTIDKGVTVTATTVNNLTYKKGMYLCVMGNLTNNGEISMTARGTYNIAGENVYLWKNVDDTYEYVPALGATGGATQSTSSRGAVLNGKAGNSGSNRQTGGGGTGGGRNWMKSIKISAGGTGTSYSGGSGSGAANSDGSGGGNAVSGAGSSIGGAGGNGAVISSNGSGYGQVSLGGAGNPSGSYQSYRISPTNYVQRRGTGGLLILYAHELCNNGSITANGIMASTASPSNSYGRVDPGGSSGGGSVNIFANVIQNNKTITATGGASANCATKGGAGGNGTVTINKLWPDLQCSEKLIQLHVGDNHEINKDKIQYINQNETQTSGITVGNINFESLNSSIVIVNQEGVITGQKVGKTKVKVTDVSHNISTYIVVEVINNTKIDVQEGKDFTIALKQNGTVWSYGLNNSGQLGIGNNDNQQEPVQIKELSNIKQIATGYSHALALTKEGKIYSWGLGKNGQLGDGQQSDSNVPVNVDISANIIKVDAYKNISIALDSEGKVYTWGEGQSILPMKVVFSETVIDISGTLMLTETGKVYDITDTLNEISDLNNIARISCGTAHNLAMDVNGTVYAWGTNTYGECGTATTGKISPTKIASKMYDISAGNCTSILQDENGKVYVLGNNANGQIGLNTTAKATALTEIILTENNEDGEESKQVEMEAISAGEGTHSGLIDTNGFVWHTGTNTYGESNLNDLTTVKIFNITGEEILSINQNDKIYLDIGESINIYCKLEIDFNLKIDLIDDVQDNFIVTMEDNNSLDLQGKTLTGRGYGSTTIKVTHGETGKSREFEVIIIAKMESLVQGFRDADLGNGNYKVLIKDQIYDVELINYDGDTIYSLENGEKEKTIELGDDSKEHKTLIVKYHGDLTIDEGVTLTAKQVDGLTYKKGMYLCVLGDIHNNGTISMTARGTYNQEGENVYLWKNIDNTYEYVPALGATGGASQYTSGHGAVLNGKSGNSGTNRQTGGGGTGGGRNWMKSITIGAGGTGTSYSGGSGSGAANSDGSSGGNAVSAAGSSIGGPGSAGIVNSRNGSGYGQVSLGGTGNPSGTNSSYRISANNYIERRGTGGLLIIYANDLYNNNTISSKGVMSSTASPSNSYGRVDPGGSSGGGSINIFANIIKNRETITAQGGESARLASVGGAGGNGSVTINELGSVLNYAKKTINIKVQDNYIINKEKITYTKLNEIQTEDLVIGKLTFETLNGDIATVDGEGKITGVAIGKTKIKITDETNGYSTYIIVNVTKEGLTIPQIKSGTDFTIALKANGTVWSFGKNTNGQLGNNTQENSNEPVQVIISDTEVLDNIVDIAAGESSAIAVNSSGEVYTWGLNVKDVEEEIQQDEEDGNEKEESEPKTEIVRYKENTLTAIKVNGLSKIEKVECHNNNFYAVDSDGKLYIWGEGYSGPTEMKTKVAVEDISGDIFLGQDGRVYYIQNQTMPIENLNSIYEISAGYKHYLFMNLDGNVYTLGAGELGQLGNNKYISTTTTQMVKTENGYLENVSSISAGNGTSMAVTEDGKAYVWGDNTNKKLGIGNAKIAYATQVTQVQDKDGSELGLKQFEIVETGNNSSYLVDKEGYVYSVGLNASGQLGTEDNKNRTVFTRIGKLDIITIPDELNILVNNSKEISIALSNAFNLKTDVVQANNLEIINTNEKKITLEEIEGVDNSDTINIDHFAPNYRITGNNIGRVNVVATAGNIQKNIWINVVNDETAKVPAKVVNGNGFTVSLKSDGTVWSWGTNTSGQLGLVDSSNKNKPEQIQVSEDIIDISSGANHTLLLGKSGKVYSFGNNGQGQLGTGNNTTFKVPTEIKLTDIVKVVAIENTSFAITSEGKVYVWGNGYGKSPVLLNIDKNVIDIGKTYYLADDGIVRTIPKAKGDTEGKEIKLSLNEYEPGTDPVIEEDRIVQISEGTDHILLLGESGKVYSYGSNVYGQLGDSTRVSRQENITTTARLGDKSILENIIEVSAGDRYSIVVTKDGKVYTFGINGEQQLGYSNDLEAKGIQESIYAIQKELTENVERVSAGYTHTSVYTEDGNVYTWGNGENGQLGNSDNSSYWEPQLVGKNIVQSNTNEILIEKGDTFNIESWVEYFNLFEDKESTIEYEILDPNIAFVDITSGQLMGLSEGRTTVIAKEVGTDKIGVISVRVLEKGTKPDTMKILVEPQVVTSGQHTIMLKVDGTVWCYGIGTYGELGNGTIKNSDQPVQANFPKGTIITKVSAGENHCLALDSTGNVWTWGRNNYYQQGNNSDENILQPTKINNLSNIKDIESGTYSSFAIGKAGEVYSWGLNANGEGGIGSYTSKITVNRALNITDAIDIKAGKNHTMILRSTGEVYVAGSNLYGELGIGSSTTRKAKQFTKVQALDEIVSIAVGDSNNIAIKKDGKVYAWGSNIYKELGVNNSNVHVDTPSIVEGLKDIRYVDGGKGYTLAIDSNKNIYEIGLNSSGELGNNSKVNIDQYEKLKSISDVMQLSAGNGYTIMLKKDGTVWACGDYTHGDTDIKSKTRSVIPVQVGNDETGLDKTEITIAVNGKEEIADNCAYEFNLIKLEENLADSLEFKSLKEEIATVDENGIVTGQKVGTTRVNATSKVDGKVYSVLVKVVAKEGQYAPKVEAGENFVSTLKASGEIWTFGYNGDGRLAIGNNLTKDVPNKTNIISTYSDIKVGKDFIIALRENGTVWSAGNNKYGQLGNGTTNPNNKLAQIQGLTDIVQIEAGEDFVLAIDDLGIVYGWGNNSNGQLGNLGVNILKPTEITVGSQRIIDIAGGSKQSAFVTAKGTVIGKGKILNGTVPDIDKAIKVEVGKDKLVILTSDMEVYEYKDRHTSKVNISNVIDTSAKNGNVMYQTVDEKTYVSGENTYGELGVGNKDIVSTPVQVNKHGEDTFGVGAGYTNTYIIENTGNVYASGNNEYGSIGNGTRDASLEHILVGERIFKVEPESATMKVGDVENIEINGNPFNLFDVSSVSNNEYEWESDAEDIVSVNNGELTALAEGIAHITITDKITNEKTIITRIVIEQDRDRILEIKVNDTQATVSSDSTEENIKYEAKVVTNENIGTLQIKTKEKTDRIKVNQAEGIDEDEWSTNGSYNKPVDLTEKFTEFTITVQTQNNNGDYGNVEYTYTLKVEKISDDIQIEKITVTSTNSENKVSEIEATPVSSTKYEVVVDEHTDLSQVTAIARNQYSFVSIDGLEYELHEQDKDIVIGNNLSREITIAIKSEAETEAEYTLVIHKKSEIMNLLNLKVNEQDAKKVSETVYVATVDNNCKLATIEASVESNLASISIANEDYELTTSTRIVNINSNTTEVTIRVKVDEDIKEYTLYIYKSQEDNTEPSLQLDMLIVNGAIVEPEKDKVTYIVYLPSAETEATIRAIAKDSTTMVKIANQGEEQGDSEKKVSIPDTENKFIVKLTDTSGNTKDYTVIIRKAEKDVSLDRVYVSKEDIQIEAELQEDGTYLVKVPSNYEDVDVTAVAGYFKARVQVSETGKYVVRQDTQHIQLETETTQVKIKVQSEDGKNEQEYILNIQKKSNNVELLSVEVDGNNVEIGTDGKYHYILKNAATSVNVKAVTSDESSYVRIEKQNYTLHEISTQINIVSKQTEVTIKVKSEDGQIKDYKLIIESLPDDATIATVVVNGEVAKYIEGKNRYEIRLDDEEFKVEVTLNDLLASMVLGENTEAIGKGTITVTKTGSETIVKVVVTSQNKLETEEYIIAILDKSRNANLDILKVNGVTINPELDGNYYAKIKNSEKLIDIEATAEDTYSVTSIDSHTNNTYIATYTQDVVEGQKIYNYTITVVSENGTKQQYNLTVEQLEANTDILSVQVGENDLELYDATKQDEETYYYKIDRVEDAYVKVTLSSSKSTVSINGGIGDLEQVNLPNEKNVFIITVTAEDGTTKDYTLIIEKKSSDTSVLSIEGEEVLTTQIHTDNADIYIDEDATIINLTITLNNKFGSLKLENDEGYELNKITREIDLSSYDTTEVVMLTLLIQAEDGTTKEYILNIYKQADTGLFKVVVNDQNLEYDEENARYETVVSNGNKPEIEIIAHNPKQKVELLNNEKTNVLATDEGSIITTQNLSTTDLTTKFIIRVTSHNGEEYGVHEYELWIKQKSIETGITYVKVDSLGTTSNEDNTIYSSTVSGKEEYPVEIKLVDENAQVRIEDLEGNILISNQTGILKGELAIPDGQTKEFKMIVTAENGNEKEYALSIKRISSNLDLNNITVTDYDEDGNTIVTKEVVIYNIETNRYSILVNENLRQTQVTVNAASELTNILLDSAHNGKGTASMSKELSGYGITTITILLTAADGTKEVRYLDIIQLSDEVGIKLVEVDNLEIKPNEAGNYVATVTDKSDISKIKVVLTDEKSKVSINKQTAQTGESTIEVNKGDNRALEIPIEVTSESGVTHTYTLTLNIISADTSVREVKVDEKVTNYVNDKYTVYIGKYQTEANIKIVAGVPYSTVKYMLNDETELSGLESIQFTMDTEDLDKETFVTTFKIVAEDESEQEYTIKLIRKSDDYTIKSVFVDDIERNPNKGNELYADGTYYVKVIGDTTNVKVITNNEFAVVEFNSKSGINSLEQTITLKDKITQIPVKITSQEGNEYETIIYIEKLSTNNNLLSIQVNKEESQAVEDTENEYISYIYDSINTSTIDILAENEYATIIRTDQSGDKYVDENELTFESKGHLNMEIPTTENSTIIYFKIVSENGQESEVYTLHIDKMSTDTSLLAVYVDGGEIILNDEGRYVANVLDTNINPVVKAVTRNNKAHVRIALGDEYLHIAEQTVGMNNGKLTIIPITVTSQAGTSDVVNLYINKISTSVELNTVKLDDKEYNYYDQESHTYRFLVDTEQTNFELFVVAESDYTTLEFNGNKYEASFKEMISMEGEAEGITLNVTAKSESGLEQEYHIEIVRKSDSVELQYLKVDDIIRQPDEEGGDTYTVGIGKATTSVYIEIKTQYSYAMVKIADNKTVRQTDKQKVSCDLSQDRIVIPIVITAADGTIDNISVILIRQSDLAQLTGVIVNDTPVENVNNVYTYYMSKDEFNANVKIYTAEDNNATIQVDDYEGVGYLEFNELFDENTVRVEKMIKVTSQDGSREEFYTLVLYKKTQIEGIITTENFEEKYTAKVRLFRRRKKDEYEDDEDILVKETNTEEDGSYVLDITEVGQYDVVIEKPGYLTYTVAGINITPGLIVEIEKYELIAGDVAEDGRINIDDLVDMNDNYGEVITEENKSEKGIYDLNEDGTVDMKDRDILKKNYGKKAETLQWVNPDEPDKISLMNIVGAHCNVPGGTFTLPLTTEYRISSEYGYRIHPITGEKKLHAGIDLVGEHNGEILSVADGVVIYAGEQNGYGNCIEIKHIVNGEAIYSFYAHLSKIDVKVGEKVNKGQVIGLEGGAETDEGHGTSTGHHLHFELRTASGSGHSVDPTKYIQF